MQKEERMRLLFLHLTPLLLCGCCCGKDVAVGVGVGVGVILDTNSTDSPVGRIGLSCLKVARHDFYSTHAAYKTRLLLQVHDSNGSLVGAAAAAIDLLQEGKVVAIVGPQKSTQVNFVMDLGDKAHVPVISFSATSPSLVHSTPYFVQTAQSDDKQVEAIASIIKAYRWSQVVIIYEDTEFGHGIMPYLSNALQDVNARVSYRSMLRKSPTDESIRTELYKMMTMQTRVFIVHMSQYLAAQLFLNVNKLGMMSQGYAWIVTSGLTDLFKGVDMDVVDAMQGVLGVRPVVPISTNSNQRKSLSINACLQANNGMKPTDGVSVFGLWAYDTFWALAMAAESVWNSGSNATKHDTKAESAWPFPVKVSETGPKLLQAFQETRFMGLAGEFHLVEGQQVQTPYEIVNILGQDLRQVGIWTRNTSGADSTSKGPFNIIWPGDTMIAPRGWEIPVSGKKLKIGVPQKPGFNEFLQVDIDPQTNATKVTGYFKEIFDAVIAALPYALPYEYSAYPFFENDTTIGSYDDLVYQVSLQEHYDAALGDITITANRSTLVDFSLPYAEGGITGMIPIKYEDANDAFAFLKPLTIELWLTIVAFYSSTALAIWIIASRNTADCRDPHAAMICYFPFFPGQGIQAVLLSLILVSWAFVASLINSTYTASLSSRLTAARLQSQVMDLTQLIKEGYYVGCQDGSFLIDFLKDRGVDASKIQRFKSGEDCVEALSLDRKDVGIMAYYDVMPHIRLLMSQNCGKYRMFGPVYRTDGFGFAFPKGSPVVADISRAIIQLTENGIIKEIEQRFTINPSCSGPDNSASPTRVGLRSFLVLFIITGCVTLTCVVVSQLNHLHQKMSFRQRMLDFTASISSKVGALWEYLKQHNPLSHAR